MSRTILLADDSVTIRKIVEITFSDTDVRVVTVGSGREALDRLEGVEPDLVIADVVMPEPTGYDVCARIKASSRPVPVLLLAGTFEPFDPERARACGADGHLVKPFESRALVARVEDLLVRRPRPLASAPPAHEVEAVLDEVAAAEAVAAVATPPRESSKRAGAAAGGRDAGPAAPAGGTARRAGAGPAPREEAAEAEGTAAAIGAGGPAPSAPASAAPLPISPEVLDVIVRAVVARLSADVVREVAWEVVPDLAETLIRERISDLEREERSRS